MRASLPLAWLFILMWTWVSRCNAIRTPGMQCKSTRAAAVQCQPSGSSHKKTFTSTTRRDKLAARSHKPHIISFFCCNIFILPHLVVMCADT